MDKYYAKYYNKAHIIACLAEATSDLHIIEDAETEKALDEAIKALSKAISEAQPNQNNG